MKILVISAHTDDAEMGCGATIHQLVSEGYDVFSVVFNASNYYPGSEKLLSEWHQSMDVLGISISNRLIFDFPARKLHEHRQDILEWLVGFKKNIDPDYIFSLSTDDLHQDHNTVGIETLRAFHDKILWSYELPSWQNVNFKPQVFIPVSEKNLEFKIKALQQYKSQYEIKRPYFSEEVIRGQAQMRGLQVGVKFAETFAVQRMVHNF